MMNKKTATLLIIILITIFLGYIVFDMAFRKEVDRKEIAVVDSSAIPDMWELVKEFQPGFGTLTSVATADDGKIILAGESFIACYDKGLRELWNFRGDYIIHGVSSFNDTVYAASGETILVLNDKGELCDEWGPFEDNAIITSVSAGKKYIAFADAGNKIVVVLDKKGALVSITGLGGKEFIIPSPYFDVAVGEDNSIYVANTGHRRVETRTVEGTLLRYFGEAGSAPDAFCGCCNPAHFTLLPEGFVTAEKGINRIKILDKDGEFVEFVSSVNKFFASIPLDVAVDSERTIYAANSQDSKLYVFKRK